MLHVHERLGVDGHEFCVVGRGHGNNPGHRDALGVLAVQAGGDEDLAGLGFCVTLHVAHGEVLVGAFACEDAGRAALLRENGDAAAGVGEQERRGRVRRSPEHAADESFVGDDGCARPCSRGVAAVDGDGIEQGIGAEVAGEHACAHRGPGFVYGQLQEFAQAREFGHVFFVGQEAGLEVTHTGLELRVLLIHVHEVHVTLPDSGHFVLHVADGSDDTACKLETHVRGKIVEHMRVLVPRVHGQEEDEQHAHQDEKSPECQSCRPCGRLRGSAAPSFSI